MPLGEEEVNFSYCHKLMTIQARNYNHFAGAPSDNFGVESGFEDQGPSVLFLLQSATPTHELEDPCHLFQK